MTPILKAAIFALMLILSGCAREEIITKDKCFASGGVEFYSASFQFSHSNYCVYKKDKP